MEGRILKRSTSIFVVFAILFVGLFVTIELINQKLYTSDLLVYYGAVNDFFSGNNPYINSYGLETGYFKYPPTTLYLFSIFSIVPFWMAQVIHITFLFASLALTFPILREVAFKIFNVHSKKMTWLLYAGTISIVVHLGREFHMGNVNLLLLLLFSVGLYYFKGAALWKTVVPWSLMLILKPIMILIIVPLIVFQQWRHIFSLGAIGVGFFLIPTMHIGFSATLDLWMDWFHSISDHGNYIVSYNSLKYMSEFYLGWNSSWGLSMLVLSILICLLILFKFNRGANNLSEWIIVFLAFVPNFFVTDTEHFLISAPLIIVLLMQLVQRTSYALWLLFVVAILPFSFNSIDFLGRELSTKVDVYAGTGLGNLTLICLYVGLLFSPIKREEI